MVSIDQLGPPSDLRYLLSPERQALLDLLESLTPADRTATTVCPGWSVHDVALHVLHDDLRRISRTRDGWSGGPGPGPGETLPNFLNAANERWVTEARCLSPVLLIDLLRSSGQAVDRMWRSIDPQTPTEGVWWAGVSPAPAWLDVAREYTEYWTHQQQIRDATGRPGLTEARYLRPVLDTFFRALPRTYADQPAATGSVVSVTAVAGDERWTWSLVADPQDGWVLGTPPAEGPAAASATLPADTWWRLATGGVSPDDARPALVLGGDTDLGGRVLDLVSVIR